MSQAGGFMPSPPSTVHSTPRSPAASAAGPTLPTPRSTPLRRGGAKEEALRRYAEERMLHISARYERRYSQSTSREPEPEPAPGASTVRGYESYGEAAADLQRVLEVVWVSGTPSIQIPFFFALAMAASEYLPSFPLAPAPTFRLLRALDTVFASLLAGQDVETHVPLPPDRRLTTTEKVRLRGIAEATRLRVARAAGDGSAAGSVVEMEVDTDDDEDDELEGFGRAATTGREGVGENRSREDPADVEMGVAGVYQRTIVALGPSLETAQEIGFSNC